MTTVGKDPGASAVRYAKNVCNILSRINVTTYAAAGPMGLSVSNESLKDKDQDARSIEFQTKLAQRFINFRACVARKSPAAALRAATVGKAPSAPQNCEISLILQIILFPEIN